MFDKEALILRVREWIVEAMPEVNNRGAASVHLDQLLGIGFNIDLSVCREAISVLAQLIADRPDIKATLHINLGSTPLPRFDPPASVEQVQDMMVDFDSPSLYLMKRALDQRPWMMEEYRRPMDGMNIGLSGKNLRVFYRSFRCLEAMHAGWEYDNGLLIEHYTDDLLES